MTDIAGQTWCQGLSRALSLETMSTPDLLQDMKIGPFALGVGSYGEVRVGTTKAGDRVAIKIMDPKKLSDSRLGLAEMRNEVRALTKLNHVHVIRYYGMETEGSCTSRWCNDKYCGCLELEPDEEGNCLKCDHPAVCHAAEKETRDTVSIVQELAAGGDLVSLLFTSPLGGVVGDVIPRSYFHQLITGIEYFADEPGKASNHQYSFTIVQEVDLSGDFLWLQ